jgi:hypothetical protein
MPFDPSDDDAWWPNPWSPRTGLGGGSPNSYDWTNPFINSRTAIPNPVASAPAPFSAAALGAMAWHPPIFLNGPSAPAPGGFPAATWPQQPFAPGGPNTPGFVGAPFGPAQSSLVPRALLDSLGAPRSINRPMGLFTPDPSLWPGGLFRSNPDPSFPLAGLPFDASLLPAPTGLDSPGATYTLGLSAGPLPLAPSPVEANAPAPGPSMGPANSTDAPAAAPTRSVLFDRPPAPLDPGALERNLANPDQTAQSLGVSDLPITKSGVPYFPPPVPPPPRLSIPSVTPPDVARFLSPYLVDYFTKTLPPPPPFPATPGKIPSLDNPYAGPAALEAITFLLPPRRLAVPLQRVISAVEEKALEAGSRAIKSAAEFRALTGAGGQIVARPYGELRGTLPAGWQAHHINQNAVYDFAIPRNEGLSVAVPGNAFSDPGTSHFSTHELLEQDFWNLYRQGGSLYGSRPTNGEYGQFGQLSYVAGGFPPPQAFGLALQAAAQRAARGFSETDPVPRIPGRLNQKR